jgi:GntR family transcriptional regulator
MRIRVDKASRIPVYVQIAEAVRDLIHGGRVPVGSALPAERVLCENFGVSRMTLRQAYDVLERDGLIDCQRGRGTFIARKRIQKQQQEMRSFTEEIAARGGSPSSRLVSFSVVKQSFAARECFGLPGDQLLWEIKRVRLSDGVPIALEHVQIPCYLCPTLDRFNLRTQSLYRILEEHFDVKLARCEEGISACRPTPEQKRYLDVAQSAAILRIERRTYSANDTLVELGITAYRGDLYTAMVRSVRVSAGRERIQADKKKV